MILLVAPNYANFPTNIALNIRDILHESLKIKILISVKLARIKTAIKPTEAIA